MSCRYQETVAHLKQVFQDDDPIEFREMQVGTEGDIRACLVFCDGLVDSEVIDNHLIRPLTQLKTIPRGEPLADAFLSRVFQVNTVKKAEDYNDIIQSVTYVDTLLLIDGLSEALLFGTKSFAERAVTEPEGEKILSGPREGFTEVMMSNLSLVRRRLRTDKLKMRYYTLGEQTNTQLCIAYLDGVVNPEIVEELYRRLALIDIDGILDANYINELIRDDPWSPFRSMGYTERPDVVTAKLLEGRVAVFVDGTPVVLTLPYLFIENFQSNEDYYLNFYYTTFCRVLRMVGFFLSIMIPAIYIAIVAYHQEMLPAPLLISIATERQSVPLPAAIEAFIMLIVFEILRETALRMQSSVGQALSIVGALVVGQAAVEAKLVAAPMIIMVALAGITSLLVPKMNAPTLLLRFGILLLASGLGFLGVTIGFAFMLAHILGLRSFGLWQLAPDKKLRYQAVKDTVVRAPWYQMLFRPEQIAQNVVRQGSRREGQP
ncbi:MAG: spore germination protein [Clostridiales bacterium]|nr:spore germination protein [Clostridiales bacterium]